jgi:glycerol-3-phosphate dehydrogenase (NAD(P)+)
VRLWARDPALARAIRAERRNPRYLPECALPSNVTPTGDLAEALSGAEVVVSATPSHSVRAVMSEAAPHLAPGAIVVSASKGIENETLLRVTEVLAEVVGGEQRLAALSGPSFAAEVCRGVPTAVTLAARDGAVAEAARDAFATPRFRVYTSTDVVGVELGGAVKNVIAIATGIVDGLAYGDNARAALVTRGLAEIARLGVAMGGNRSPSWGSPAWGTWC